MRRNETSALTDFGPGPGTERWEGERITSAQVDHKLSSPSGHTLQQICFALRFPSLSIYLSIPLLSYAPYLTPEHPFQESKVLATPTYLSLNTFSFFFLLSWRKGIKATRVYKTYIHVHTNSLETKPSTKEHHPKKKEKRLFWKDEQRREQKRENKREETSQNNKVSEQQYHTHVLISDFKAVFLSLFLSLPLRLTSSSASSSLFLCVCV